MTFFWAGIHIPSQTRTNKLRLLLARYSAIVRSRLLRGGRGERWR